MAIYNRGTDGYHVLSYTTISYRSTNTIDNKDILSTIDTVYTPWHFYNRYRYSLITHRHGSDRVRVSGRHEHLPSSYSVIIPVVFIIEVYPFGIKNRTNFI